MENHVATCDRSTRKEKSRRGRIIHYRVVDREVTVEIDGDEIRIMRKGAGFSSQEKFALACGWSQTEQFKYEKIGKNEIKLKKVFTMSVVCRASAIES